MTEGLHENSDDLSKETRDIHRALSSLQEELEAVDWYRQRTDAVNDSQLRKILLHNMREEMEHAAMLIEWLRRNDSDLNNHLRTYLFTTAPIVENHEDNSEEPTARTDTDSTIGTLKE